MRIVRLRSAARVDIHTCLNYLEQESGSSTIRRRFLVAFEKTTRLLAAYPEMGRVGDVVSARGETLRRFPIEQFDNYLIFYGLSPSTLWVTRILHGSQDRSAIFATTPDA